jgi:CHAT domain-containing protein
MTAFYNALEERVDKAEALAAAMDFVRSCEQWRHPYFWARLWSGLEPAGQLAKT